MPFTIAYLPSFCAAAAAGLLWAGPAAAFAPQSCMQAEPDEARPAAIAARDAMREPVTEAGGTEYARGLLYYLGRDVRRDPAEAARWFQAGAEKGNAHARYFLGDMQVKGDGVPRDLVAGRDMLKAAVPGLSGAMKRNAACYAIGVDHLLAAAPDQQTGHTQAGHAQSTRPDGRAAAADSRPAR